MPQARATAPAQVAAPVRVTARRRHGAALGAVLLAAPLLAGAVPATPTTPRLRPVAAVDEYYPVPPSGAFTVDGHGWGHGHGMSQWGAQGAADLGVSATTITATYYPGTVAAQLPNSALRVSLDGAPSGALTVLGERGLTVTDGHTGAHAAPGSTYPQVRVVPAAAGLRVQGLRNGSWTTLPVGTAGTAVLSGPVALAAAGATVGLAEGDGSVRYYRGSLTAQRAGSGIWTISVVAMEDYLRGVVPREAVPSWRPAALQAQAIAARSYAGYLRAAGGGGADLCDSDACQVYGGAAVRYPGGALTSLETAATDAAVAATAGVVRSTGSGVHPIFAQFAASNGGWSTAGSEPYLQAHADPWDGVDPGSAGLHSWTATLTASALQDRYGYAGLGRLTAVEVTGRDGNGEWGGRVQTVVLHGVDSSGHPTTVDASGDGIALSRPWPAYSDGLLGSWFHLRPVDTATRTAASPAPTFVTAPGVHRATLSVAFRNTGQLTWSLRGLHLRPAGGGGEPWAGGATTLGTAVRNLDQPAAASVAPGQRALLTLTLDAGAAVPASYRKDYTLTDDGRPLAAAVGWVIPVQAARLTAALLPATSVTLSSPGVAAHPVGLPADGSIALLPAGTARLAVTVVNTGNVAWPAGAVRLATDAPRGRTSAWSTSSWVIAGTRPAAVGTAVPPGARATVALTLGAGTQPVGAGGVAEPFTAVWDGTAWLGGASLAVTPTVVDPRTARAAISAGGVAPATASWAAGPPEVVRSVTVRLRNTGTAAWTVGAERVGTADGAASPLATRDWAGAAVATALTVNASAPGASTVPPGQVGLWVVPVRTVGVAPATYRLALRAVPAGGGPRYGPTLTAALTVTAATTTATVRSAPTAVRLPRAGSAAFDVVVANTGTVPWPVGGLVRLAVLGGPTSPSACAGWLDGNRPTAVTANVTTPGAASVPPGQLARLHVTVCGNNAPAGTTTERLGLVWDGWRFFGPTLSVHLTRT